MIEWTSVASKLFGVQRKERRWAYIPIICIESFISFWGMAEGGIPAARRSVILVISLLIQFFWPRVVIWLVLFGLYIADVVGVLRTGHIANDYGGLVLYGVPCAALLWALPPLLQKESKQPERASTAGPSIGRGTGNPVERLAGEQEIEP